MLILLNKQLVMVEMLEWAKLRLAEIMRVPPSATEAKWMLNAGGEVVPSFGVDKEHAEGVSEYQIKEVCKAVSREMNGMLVERLEGLSQRRV